MATEMVGPFAIVRRFHDGTLWLTYTGAGDWRWAFGQWFPTYQITEADEDTQGRPTIAASVMP